MFFKIVTSSGSESTVVSLSLRGWSRAYEKKSGFRSKKYVYRLSTLYGLIPLGPIMREYNDVLLNRVGTLVSNFLPLTFKIILFFAILCFLVV